MAIGTPWDTLIYLLAYGGLRWGETVALRRHRCQLLRSRVQIVESLSEDKTSAPYATPWHFARPTERANRDVKQD